MCGWVGQKNSILVGGTTGRGGGLQVGGVPPNFESRGS
jgi:hypothetical protein